MSWQCDGLVGITKRPHYTIHPPFWGLAGITGANGSSWN